MKAEIGTAVGTSERAKRDEDVWVRVRFWHYSIQIKHVLCNCRSITRNRARVNHKPDDLGVREVLQDLVSESWMARDVHDSYCLLERNRNDGRVYLHGCLCWYILVVRKLNKNKLESQRQDTDRGTYLGEYARFASIRWTDKKKAVSSRFGPFLGKQEYH